MLTVDRIPHLRIYRQKVRAPYNENDPKKGSLLIFNTKSVDGIQPILSNPRLDHRNKYTRLYIDRRIHTTLINKNIIRNLKAERESKYDIVQRKFPLLQGVTESQLIRGFNTVYDISTLNELFFAYTMRLPLQKRSGLYMEFIMKFIDDRFSSFDSKTMFINVDEWTSNIKVSVSNKKDVYNPILCIYFAMLKNSEKFLAIGDLDIIFTNNDGLLLRLNPALCAQDMSSSIKKFRTELFKMNTAHIPESQVEEEKMIEEDNTSKKLAKEVISQYTFGATGEIPENVKEVIEDKVETIVKTKNVEYSDEAQQELEQDKELIKKIATINAENKTGKSAVSSKRDEELRKKQLEIKIGNKTLKEIISESTDNIKIEEKDVFEKVDSTNKNITKVKYPNLDKVYNEQLAQKDLMNIILGLNNKEIPIYVRSIKKEDSSDLLNYKDTYRIELEDSNRVRHVLTFDVPKFVEDKFLYIGGNRKMINRQQFMIPIAKTGPDTVQTCTNYNKIFVRRYGAKISSEIEKFKKALTKGVKGVSYKKGNFLKTNQNYMTTLDYDDLSKSYKDIKVGSTTILFDQRHIREEFSKKGIKIEEGFLPIGTNSKGQIYLDLNTQTVVEVSGKNRVDTDKMLVEYICSLSSTLSDEVGSTTSGKKYVFTRATIMKKDVPISLILAYFEGISGFLKRAEIKHYFSDTRPRVGYDEGIIQFNNGYLVYDKYPFKNSLLMNGLIDVPTKAFDYEDFEDKQVYLSIFETLYKRRNIAIAFDNFYDNFVDPITLEILESMNLPTDITGILLYANELLVDNQYTKENELNLYRIRSNEVVNAVIYQEITKAYERYSTTAQNANPKKISVPKDIIIKQLQMLQTVEDYSVLNPIVEVEKSRATTAKGVCGCNLKESYSLEKRSFDDSMIGIFAMSTSPDANCGVVRELTAEPNIVSPRGFMDLKGVENTKELNDSNLFGYAELLSPLGASRDDSTRTAMATKQAKHVVPVKNASPVLISNGAEQTIHYHLSKDFSFVAQEDGEVVEKDPKTGLFIVKYKSGKTEAIDVNPRIVKNGAGGFYLSNQLQTSLNIGDKFKKDDVLASDKKFFTDSKTSGNRFNIGSLQKVAVASSYATYEDSTFITKKLSSDMASEVVMDKGVVLGKNTSVDYMVKVGQEVKVGDELITFERSFNEDSLNELLANVGEELREDIKMAGKDKVKSKYSGVIEDIKIYCTVDLEELSPSLRKIVSDYYAKVDKKRKLLDKYDESKNPVVKCGMLFNDPSSKTEAKNNKIKGHHVGEGVLIEFFIKYYDEMAVGDKLAFFTALKSIVGEVIEEGEEPFSEFRPEEEVSSVIAPAAIIARGTPSIVLTMFANKVLVELKRTLKDIYDGKK